QHGLYHPREYHSDCPVSRRVMAAFRDERFWPREPGLLQWICRALLEHDEYFHLAELESYIAAQAEASRTYTDRAAWAKKAVLNVARMGFFSSDRTISDYAKDIWDLRPA